MDAKSIEKFNQLCTYMPLAIYEALASLNDSIKSEVQEIRLRAEKPVNIVTNNHNLFISAIDRRPQGTPKNALTISKKEIYDVFRAVCEYSIHTFQSEIAEGFVTIKGGHRVGIAGTAVTKDFKMTGIRDISSLNFRLARQVTGAADAIVAMLPRPKRGLLVAGPPSSGKTTILKDLCRQYASGEGARRVTIIDERSEIASVYQGIAQNDVGVLTDVLDGFEKARGIQTAIRTLSPEIIVCDEIGSPADIEAIKSGINCGVCIVASVHAESLDEALGKPFVRELIEMKAFELVVLLGTGANVGRIIASKEVGV